jgi:hypothetical protein
LKTTTVLISHSNTVLDLGILNILESVHGFILRQAVTDNIDQLLEEVEINHPEVVILIQGSKIPRHDLYRSLLARVPQIRILTIYIDSNQVCIHQKQTVKIQKASDIIGLILNEASSSQDFQEKG